MTVNYRKLLSSFGCSLFRDTTAHRSISIFKFGEVLFYSIQGFRLALIVSPLSDRVDSLPRNQNQATALGEFKIQEVRN